jgi:uncharacterized protein YndB with AHSA1/START domain
MPTTTSDRKAKVTVQGEKEILIEREFDAPARLVWEAFTTPEHVERWWTARRGAMTVCEIDFRVGGKWRYVMNAANGMEVGFHGEYLEIEPHSRIVSTEAYEGIPDADANAATNVMTLSERDGRTQLAILVEHKTREGRDMHIESGMEDGLQDALDDLERIAQSLGA